MGAVLAISFGRREKQGGTVGLLRPACVHWLWHNVALGGHGHGIADELGDALEPGVQASDGGVEPE